MGGSGGGAAPSDGGFRVGGAAATPDGHRQKPDVSLFNRFAHSAGPISRVDSALAFVQ